MDERYACFRVEALLPKEEEEVLAPEVLLLWLKSFWFKRKLDLFSLLFWNNSATDLKKGCMVENAMFGICLKCFKKLWKIRWAALCFHPLFVPSRGTIQLEHSL